MAKVLTNFWRNNMKKFFIVLSILLVLALEIFTPSSLCRSKVFATEEDPQKSTDNTIQEISTETTSNDSLPDSVLKTSEVSPVFWGSGSGDDYQECSLNSTTTGTIPDGVDGIWRRLVLDKSYILQLTHSNDTFIYKQDKSESLWNAWGINKTEYGCLLKGTYLVWVKNNDSLKHENPYSLIFRPVEAESNYQSSEENYDDINTSNDIKGQASEYRYAEGLDEFTIHGLCGYNNNVDWYHFQFHAPVKISFESTNYTYTYKENKNTGYIPNFTVYEGDTELFHTDPSLPKTSRSLMGIDYYVRVTKYNYVNNNSNFHSYEIKVSPADKTVTYDANGGTGIVPEDSGNYVSGESIKLKSGSTLQRSGYQFKGWSTSANGSEPLYQDNADYTIGQSSVTFYAVWVKICHVSYDGNGATAGSVPMDTRDYCAGDTVKVKWDNTLQRTGYRFKGWCTNKDGSGHLYNEGDEYKNIQNDTVFYAIWNQYNKLVFNYDEEIRINYAGYAIAHIHLVDGERNPIVNPGTELICKSSLNTETITVDKNNYIDVQSDLYTYKANGDNEHVFTATVTDMSGDEVALISINNITVKDISYTQKWNGKMDVSGTVKAGIGAGLKIGLEDAEASLGDVGITRSIASTMEVENAIKEGQRNLSITQKYDRRTSLKGSLGPKAEAVNKAIELTALEVSASAGVGQQVSSGIKIKNYDATDPDNALKIGKHLLFGVAESSGNVYLMRVLEFLGYKGTSDVIGSKVSLEGKGGIDFLKAQIGKGYPLTAEASVMSGETGGVLSFEATRDRSDSSGALFTKKKSYARNGSINLFDVSVEAFKDKPLNVKTGFHGPYFEDQRITDVSVSGKIDGLSDTNKNKGNITKITYGGTMYQDDGICEADFYDTYNELSHKVEFSDDDAQIIVNAVPAVGNFYESFIGGISKDDIADIEACKTAKATFSDTCKEKTIVNAPPLELGLKAGVGVEAGVKLTGIYEESYDIDSGLFNYDEITDERNEIKTSICDDEKIEAIISDTKTDILTILSEPIKSVASVVNGFVKDVAGNIGETIENGFAKVINNSKNRVAHIAGLAPRPNSNSLNADTAPTSYEIFTYSDERAHGEFNGTQESENVASTVGEPYIVYLTDEVGNSVSDWNGDTVTLVLKYTDESLASAGVSESDAPFLAVYKYSQDKLGYVYMGGTVDTVNKSVTLDISEEGQYILAIDNVAPIVYVFTTENDSNPPVIIAGIDEMSGFSEFSLKLDDKEVVSLSNFDQYYEVYSKSLKYQIKEKLTPGTHKATLIAADAVGNRMAAPIELEIIISDSTQGVTVTFNSDGGSTVESQTINSGETVPKPTNPTKEGHTFLCWMLNNVEYDFTQPVTQDITLIAKWKSNTPDTPDVLDDIPTDKEVPAGIWLAGIEPLTYDGTKQTQDFRVYDNTKLLVEKTDYTVAYKNNVKAYTVADPKNPTDADKKYAPQVILTMKGDYSGKETAYFSIEPLSIEDDTAFSAYLKGTGAKQKPVLMWNGKALKAQTDYTVSSVGGVITLTGTGNFTGTRTIDASAGTAPAQVNMSKVKVSPIPAQVFKGSAYGIGDLKAAGGVSPFVLTVSNGADTLKEGIDYRVVKIMNGTKVGTATVVLRGLNAGGTAGANPKSFIGEKRVTFKITGYPMLGADISVTGEDGSETLTAPYRKGGAKPALKVRFGETVLKEGRDYTLKYTGNTKYPSTNASVVILGKGNFAGKKTVPFSVTQRPFTDAAGITVVAGDKAVGKKANQYQTSVKVFDAEGKLLRAGTDYEKTITYLQGGQPLSAASFPQAGEKVTVRVTGKGGYSDDTIDAEYTILSAGAVTDIGKATIQIKDQQYDKGRAIEITSPDQIKQAFIGKNKTPLTLSADGVTGDFMVVPGSYVKNTAKGTASVTFMGINGYSGAKTVKFKIGARSIIGNWFGWLF